MKTELEDTSSHNRYKLNIKESITERIETIQEYLDATNALELLRRYGVMNAFDGALTMLGFIMGSYVAGVRDPRVIISAGISASFAMGLSGFVGALITEKAERERQVKELEKVLFANLKGSFIDRASKMTVIFAAIVDAVSPAIAALISSMPIIFAFYKIINFDLAVQISILLTLGFIFSLGLYLGKISGENPLRYGFYMLTAGIILSIISNMFGFWGG